MARSIFKNDKFKSTRGGYSRMLAISCEKCGELICHYQKDGPGYLRRMYLDRIINPKVDINSNVLSCTQGHILGTAIIYEKENRPAFRLHVDAVTKKIVKL